MAVIEKADSTTKSDASSKEITPLMNEFVSYIKEQTGYDADPKSVQLGGILRGAFQKSEGNQARMAARREEVAAQAKSRAEKKASAPEKAEKVVKAPAEKAEKVVKAPAEKKTPVAKINVTPKTTTPSAKVSAKAAPVRRRPAVKKDDADF